MRAQPPRALDETGVIAGPEALIDWAIRKRVSEASLREQMHSRVFVGSGRARKAAIDALAAALRQQSFDSRKLDWEDNQLMEAEVNRQQAAAEEEKRTLEAHAAIIEGDRGRGNALRRAQAKDSEAAVGRGLEASSPGWAPQERIRHLGVRGNLMSTVPEYFKENVRGKSISVEVKNVSVSDLKIGFEKWAEQLARRNMTISQNYPKTPLQNWIFADLRGLPVEVDLPDLAKRIKRGVAKAGATEGKAGATYQKVFFILDSKIVEMP